MITIKDCTPEDIPAIMDIAKRTWRPTYAHIITEEQICYMLDTIYSAGTLQQTMNDGSQRFILLYEHHVPQGFASYGQRQEDPRIYKLHKLYVLPATQGKGFGKRLIEEIKDRLRLKSVHTLDLNVNRYNAAKSFYEHLGFKVIGEEDIPVGPYWMNDYVMRLQF